jgi:hypothetical protein
MIKSFFRYIKYFSYCLFHPQSGILVLVDFLRFILGRKVISNTTINPWTDKSYPENERVKALEKAVQWLLTAQESMADDGFGSFHLINGWTSSYVETSGYIIPTLLEYGISEKNGHIINMAISSANWLVNIQKASGGWQGGCVDDKSEEVVFNTGQVIRGLFSVYEYTKDFRYLNSAIAGCDWLCKIQETGGYWETSAFMGVPRVYDSYLDFPLLLMYKLTGNEVYKQKAIKNLNWILEEKQLENGWFEDCDNTIKNNHRPILHTISYTIDGILECGILLNDKRLIDAAVKSADRLFEIFNKNKYLKARYDRNWIGSEYLIPAGSAQIAIIWLKLFRLTGNIQYLNAALKMNDILIFIQDRNIKEDPSTEGALPGSYPVWGKYEPFCYPNWATKFFADSLLLEKECLKSEKEEYEDRHNNI